MNQILFRLGRKIRSRRRFLNMTQEEVASLTELGTRSYQRIESGKIAPNFKSLYKISMALLIPLSDLLAPEDIHKEKDIVISELPSLDKAYLKDVEVYERDQLKEFSTYIQRVELESPKSIVSSLELNKLKESKYINYASRDHFILNYKSKDNFEYQNNKVCPTSIVGPINKSKIFWDNLLASPFNLFKVKTKLFTSSGEIDAQCLFYVFNRDHSNPEALWIYKDISNIKKTFKEKSLLHS